MLSLKNIAPIALEIFLIEYCTVLEETPIYMYDIISFFSCIIQKHTIIVFYSKKKNTFILKSHNESIYFCVKYI